MTYTPSNRAEHDRHSLPRSVPRKGSVNPEGNPVHRRPYRPRFHERLTQDPAVWVEFAIRVAMPYQVGRGNLLDLRK